MSREHRDHTVLQSNWSFSRSVLRLVYVSVCSGMSSVHAQDSSFLGGRIPPEIDSLAKNLKDVDQELFRKILKGKYSTKISLVI